MGFRRRRVPAQDSERAAAVVCAEVGVPEAGASVESEMLKHPYVNCSDCYPSPATAPSQYSSFSDGPPAPSATR